MWRAILPLLPMLLVAAPAAEARTLQARIARVTTAVATLEDVRVRLDWPADAPGGRLALRAARADAPDLGYRFRDLRWECPLQRAARHGWRCDGEVRGARGRPLRLAVAFDDARLDAALMQGGARLSAQRLAATPDDTSIDLARVPLAWAQALLAQAWSAGQLKSGTLDGRLRVRAPSRQPLQVAGTLAVADAAFDTPDATIAGEHLGGRFAIDYRTQAGQSSVVVDGQLRGGELLAGNAYVALPPTPVGLRIEGRRDGPGGWRLPHFAWRDGDVLVAEGSAAFDADAALQDLALSLRSADIAPWRERYLGGWLGLFDLAELQLKGALEAVALVAAGRLQSASAALHDIDLVDPKGRFRFEGLGGTPRFSADAPVTGELHWRGGELYGLAFQGASMPVDSRDGALQLRDAVTVPMLGGSLRFDGMTLRPPSGEAGADIRFGLAVDRLDVGQLAQALGLPAFQGQLSGRIPNARYSGERLVFDGGLTMQLFGGSLRVSSLSMERPFGVAPSLAADLALDDIDLQALTGVFDFGSISGKLDGRIDALRLVDWTATAFDAELYTDPKPGVRQRISQRAVQNISSVGDSSFTTTLQSRLIGLFDDFGYSRIGISCRLANEVCEMGGLHSAGAGFTIVEGAGIPHLTVVGFNRLVDWPTLVERLAAASQGDLKPVVE